MRRVGLCGIGWVVFLLSAGCETGGGDDKPDFGQVRVQNDWTQPVVLETANRDPRTIFPGKSGYILTDEGPQSVLIRDEQANVLFQQQVDVPDNTFAKYTVTPDGEVVAGAGNIDKPDVVGSDREQIAVENRSDSTVGLFANGNKLADIGPLRAVTVEVANVTMEVSIRTGGGRTLFQQTVSIPRNTVIRYIVEPDLSVIATGGAIEQNYDVDRGYQSSYTKPVD